MQQLKPKILLCILSAVSLPKIAECQGRVEMVFKEEFISQTLSGHVQIGDSTEGVKNVLVEVCTPRWKKPVVSTKTDSGGNFSFPTPKSGKLYYLRLTLDGMNPMLLKMRVKASGPKRVDLHMVPSA